MAIDNNTEVLKVEVDNENFKTGMREIETTTEETYRKLAEAVNNYGQQTVKVENDVQNESNDTQKIVVSNNKKKTSSNISLDNAMRSLVRRYFTYSAIVRVVNKTVSTYLKTITEVEAGMRKLNTIMGVSDEVLYDFESSLRKTASDAGVLFKDMIDGTYEALSVGIPNEGLGDFMAGQAELARVGFTTVSKSVKATTTVMSAYNLGVEEQARVNDMLVASQKQGRFTIDQYTESLARVAPVASSLGLSFEDVSGAMVQLTLDGNNARTSATQLSQLMTELGQDSSTLSKIIVGETGKSFQHLLAEGKDLGYILEILDGVAKSTTSSLSSMTDSRTTTRALATLTKNVEETKKAIQGVADGAGSVSEASKQMEKDLNSSFNRLKNSISQLFWNERVKNNIQNFADFASEKLDEVAADNERIAKKRKELYSGADWQNRAKELQKTSPEIYNMYKKEADYSMQVEDHRVKYSIKRTLDYLKWRNNTVLKANPNKINSTSTSLEVAEEEKRIAEEAKKAEEIRNLEEHNRDKTFRETLATIRNNFNAQSILDENATAEKQAKLAENRRESELYAELKYLEGKKGLQERFNEIYDELAQMETDGNIQERLNNEKREEDAIEKALTEHEARKMEIRKSFRDLRLQYQDLTDEEDKEIETTTRIAELEADIAFYEGKEMYRKEYLEAIAELDEIEIQATKDKNAEILEENKKALDAQKKIDDDAEKERVANLKKEQDTWTDRTTTVAHYISDLINGSETLASVLAKMTGNVMVMAGEEIIAKGVVKVLEGKMDIASLNPLGPGKVTAGLAGITGGTALIAGGTALGALGSSVNQPSVDGDSSESTGDSDVQEPEEIVNDANSESEQDTVIIQGAEVITDVIESHYKNIKNVNITAKVNNRGSRR